MTQDMIVPCPNCGVKNRIPQDKLGKPAKCGRCKAPLPTGSTGPITLTDLNFDQVIGGSQVALVDCWAPWCGPCRMIGPVIDDLAREFGGRAVIGKLNVDQNPSISQRYGIRSIPTLLFFKNGELFDTIVGAVPPQQIRERLISML